MTKQPYSPIKKTRHFFVCLINISYFCNRLSQSIKGRRVKTSWIHASTTAIEVGDLTSARSIKGRFQTLSSTSKTSQPLVYLKISQQSVHVGCIISVCLLSDYWLTAYNIHNTQRRGQAKLLISVDRQCEGLGCGVSGKCFPTSFCIHTFFNY